ncbi:MAG: hypothetical protein ACRD27_03985 [Terracidiphilus sp.]
MPKNLLAILFLVCCPLLVAQQAMTNASVIKLAQAGLSDSLIITTIDASPGAYDTSANGLIALKQAGVSDKVVDAIVIKASGGSAPAASAPSTAAAPANPDNPAAPHDAGIYIYSADAAAGSKMMMLEPNVYTQGKTGGMFASAMTYGIAKVKVKAVLRGAHANARVIGTQPVFYFYFEEKSAGLSNASTIFGGTSTPNEYTLLKFDVKKDTRETIIGSANAFGASGGTDEKAVVPFTYTRLRPGAYKVVLNSPLQPGEYGFIASGGSVAVGPYGGTTNSRVFDFGRD